MVVCEKVGEEDDSIEDDQYDEEEGEEGFGGASYLTCAGKEESVVDGAVFLMCFVQTSRY